MSKLKPSKIIQGRVDQNIGLQQAALGMAPPTQARLRMPRKQTQIKLQHCNTCSDTVAEAVSTLRAACARVRARALAGLHLEQVTDEVCSPARSGSPARR